VVIFLSEALNDQELRTSKEKTNDCAATVMDETTCMWTKCERRTFSITICDETYIMKNGESGSPGESRSGSMLLKELSGYAAFFHGSS
jgi:hypothetical protein